MKSFTAVIAALLLTALTGCNSTPDTIPVAITTTEGALPAALAAVDDIEDTGHRVEALLLISEGLLESGAGEDAIAVAAAAARLLNTLPLTDEVVGLELRTTALLLKLDQIDVARRLIVGATNYAASARDESTRAVLLPLVIQTAITGGDETRDLLPPIVDPVYVMEDTLLRARTFIAIAEAYQSVGLDQSVLGLIQQSIPAIRSVTNPEARARLFGNLAVRAFGASQFDLAASLVVDALKELSLALSNSEPDSETVAAVYNAVAIDRGAAEAVTTVSGALSARRQAEAYLAIAGSAESNEGAILALRRASDTLPGVTDPAEQSLLIVSIARGFLVADRRREAIDATEEAVALLALIPGESSRVETLIAVSGLYPQLARAVSLTSAINELEDPYARALVLLAVAEALIAEGQPGVADDFLVSALDDADSSEFLSDDLKIRIVEGFARTQSYGLAVSAIERISSRSARARAAAYLGRYADPRGGLTEDQRDVLGDALRL